MPFKAFLDSGRSVDLEVAVDGAEILYGSSGMLMSSPAEPAPENLFYFYIRIRGGKPGYVGNRAEKVAGKMETAEPTRDKTPPENLFVFISFLKIEGRASRTPTNIRPKNGTELQVNLLAWCVLPVGPDTESARSFQRR